MTRLGAGGEEWRAFDEAGAGPGYRPDDAALAASQRDIQTHRTGEVCLRLVDRTGRPMAKRVVELQLLRHAFWFGDNLWELDRMSRLGLWDSDRCRAWRRVYAELFQAANALCYWTERPRNDASKTEEIQGETRVEHFARCVDWVTASGMYCKGHPLFWSIPKAVPDWVQRYDPETRMKFVEVRVRNLMARFGRQVTVWDAINEPLWEATPAHLQDRNWPHLESIADIADYIEPVLRWSRQEQPDVRLVINEYGLETGRDSAPAAAADGTLVTPQLQRKRMIELMNELCRRGAAPNAIGLQSHTGGFISRAEQHELYDQMAATGLAVQITEFWPPKADAVRDEQEREAMICRYVTDYLTHAFAHPAVESFFFWGLLGRAVRWHDRDNSGHETTALYHAVRHLIREQWHTHVTDTTDESGCIRFRGFFGDYGLRLGRAGDQRGGYRFRLDPTPGGLEPNTLTVVVEEPVECRPTIGEG